MATINDLNVSISQMEFADACALVKKLRFNRRDKPKPPSKRAKKLNLKKAAVKNPRKTATKSLSKLSKAQKMELLKLLEGAL